MPKRRATTGHKTSKDKDLRVTLAGRKLRKLLYRTDPSRTISSFANEANVHRISVHRLLNGERWRHIDVDFALNVMDATSGYIKIEDFASITAVPKEDADKEDPRRTSSRRFARTGTDG